MSVLPPPILFLAWLGALIPRVGVALEEPAQPAIDQRQIQAATLLDEAIDADQGSGIAAAVQRMLRRLPARDDWHCYRKVI